MGGVPLLPGTAIIPGETIVTGAGGAVVMGEANSTGGMVDIGPDSTVFIAPNGRGFALQLIAGSAIVTGLTVETPQGTLIEPAHGGTEYLVDAGNTRSLVGVIMGVVQLIGLNRPVTRLTAGQADSLVLDARGVVDTTRANFSELTSPPVNSSLSARPAASTIH